MKILYGVQGTGNGHIARARVMAEALKQHPDISVDFLFTGRKPDKYFDMDVFGDYQTRRGLTFVTRQGKVSKWQTLKHADMGQFFHDVNHLKVANYDLLLNDFEPVSAWAAKRHSLPSISVSHQAAFTYDVPKKGESLYDRVITRYFAPCDIQLGVHWYHFGHAILPPFIHETVDVTPHNQHFLVYLPFEALNDIKTLLTPFSHYQFHCFHPDVTQDSVEGNIHWFAPSKPKFREAQKHCAGVIANGGFELSSECLKLGKKLLIKPLQGQYEQASNMLTLQRLGLCTGMEKLDSDTLRSWLGTTAPDPINYPGDPTLFIEWLKQKDWHNTETLCKSLWNNVEFPESVSQKLAALHT
ncbi:glycosyltransferase [Aestuariibacter sp. AA17]|uniref:Glycosyltransferase n=1 Tax=Fluctibacter corallii TaxID=2984329 RepID=A0ABT3AC82_9ALTE|nr:MJ1255/VC2487 family glycosyltransferase [Aestuariibacter sp. AA17]MCV2886239.1 glycosyltransferase [Aestuariibacter sp. AA17]